VKKIIYDQLCDFLNKILITSGRIETHANHYLNVIGPHPVSINKYNNISILRIKIRLIKVILSNVYDIIAKINFSKTQRLDKKNKIVIISHLLNHGQLKSTEDFYFGDIQKNNNGIYFININHACKKNVNYKVENKEVVPQALNIIEEIKIRFVLLKEVFLLKREISNKCKTKFEKRIKNKILIECLSRQTVNNLRIYYYLKARLPTTLEKIIFTHEGHSWERMASCAAYYSNRSCVKIGYQHSIIFPNQNAIFQKYSKHLLPDKVLNSGEITNGLFKLKGISSLICGSIKYNEINKKNNTNNKPNEILIIPDGTISEVRRLYDFANKLLLIDPNLNIRFRLHPVVSNKELIDNNIYFTKSHRESSKKCIVYLSRRSIKEDLNSARFCIYRGSGAVIEAIQNGVQPIYLNINTEMNIDPLFFLSKWRIIVDTAQEAIDKMIIEMNNESKNILIRKEAMKTGSVYFTKFRLEYFL